MDCFGIKTVALGTSTMLLTALGTHALMSHSFVMSPEPTHFWTSTSEGMADNIASPSHMMSLFLMMSHTWSWELWMTGESCVDTTSWQQETEFSVVLRADTILLVSYKICYRIRKKSFGKKDGCHGLAAQTNLVKCCLKIIKWT